MSQIKTEAIVLKHINWSDTSRIVTLLTPLQGKIKVIAKGARRKNSAYTGVLEALNLIEAVIYIAPGRDLQTLGTSSVQNNYIALRNDLEKMSIAYSVAELVELFYHQDESGEIFFEFLKEILNGISVHSRPELIFWYFLIKYSSFLGFKPVFDSCVYCGNSIQTSAVFKTETGTVTCEDCGGRSEPRQLISAKILNRLAGLQSHHYKKLHLLKSPEEEEFPYTKFLLNYLAFHTDKPINLKSLQIFSTIR